METAGQRLKQARERLGLRYRDVAEASLRIANRHRNPEFTVALSRLSDIENKGTVPNIYRLYSLCAIYRLDMREVMRWFGVQADNTAADMVEAPLAATHPAAFADILPAPAAPETIEAGDPNRTRFFSQIHRWGRIASARLVGFDAQHYRYGYMGLEDWSMHPLISPGALLMVDVRRRKIAVEGWSSEYDRPLYFLELRDGYRCGWCSLAKDTLTLLTHPASSVAPSFYRFPDEIEVVGEVVGTASLRAGRGPHPGATTPAGSPNP